MAWWGGDTKLEKEGERLEIASGTVLWSDRVRFGLSEGRKVNAKIRIC